MGGDEGRDPRDDADERPEVMVGHRAFDELLDCAAKAEEEGEASGDGDAHRRQFAMAVHRAVKKALAFPERDVWRTQTMKRYRCRLYFHGHDGVLHLVACVPLHPHLDGAVDTS